MATGVNVKMGVSGVQQFKQGMKESQAAVKTLDQALKLNEQQLKSTGDAELYLQNKTKILEDQIEKQTQVVKQSQAALDAMRRNGVQETSTAFQQMQANVYKASTDLMRMRTELDNVGDSGADAATEADTLTESLQNVGKGISWQNVTSGIEKITGGLEAAAKAALRMGRAIVSATLEGGQWADELQTTADQWEIDPERLYRMRQTANEIDTDAETILSAQQRLQKGLGKSDTGVMGAYAALLGEGYNPKDVNFEDAFWDAGDALMRFSDIEEREAYAQTLFGRSWRELIPLFKAGREEYEEAMSKWTWVGDEQFENLKKVDDASNELNSEWEALKRQFEGTMADVMTPVMETLTGLLKEFNTYLQSEDGQAMLKSLGDAISGLFEDLKNTKPEDVLAKIKDALDGVKSALNWIKTNKQGIKTAIEAIALAWAGMKLGGLAANIGQIVNGLKGLGGAGAAGSAASSAASGASGIGNAIAGGAGGTSSVLFGAGTTAASILLAAPMVKRIAEEGAGFLNPFSDYYKSKTPDVLDLIGGEGTGAIWEKVMQNQHYDNSWMPEVSPFAENLQHYYAEPIDRMSEVAGETTEAVTQSTAVSTQMTEALKGFETMPATLQAAVEKAVISGMNSVTIVINEGAVDLIGQRTMGGGGQRVLAMIQ